MCACDSFREVNQSLSNPSRTPHTNNGVAGQQTPDTGRGPCWRRCKSPDSLNTSPPGHFCLWTLENEGLWKASSGDTWDIFIMLFQRMKPEKTKRRALGYSRKVVRMGGLFRDGRGGVRLPTFLHVSCLSSKMTIYI